MNKIFKSLYFSFGIYGFTREFRSKSYKRFLTEKLCLSTFNGIIYLTLAIHQRYISLKKLEIKLKKLDKKLNKDEYKEIFGSKCYSTL